MTDRNDDFGSFRPSRDASASEQRRVGVSPRPGATRPYTPHVEPAFAAPPASRPPASGAPASGMPASDPATSEPHHFDPRPPAPTRPVPAPPRPNADGIHEFEHSAEALPRVARTGPARPVPRAGGTSPAPVRRSPAAPAERRVNRYDEDDDEPRSGLRVLKWLGYTAVAGTTLAVAGAIALMVYAPVDLVRDRLISEVKARTGRDLVIGGRPTVSFWPNVAISVSDVTLSNPPGMAGAPLVTMPRLDATIRLWPLLSKQVLVDRLVLKAPTIALVTDAQGRRNWDFAEAAALERRHGAAPRRVQVAKVGPLDLEDLPEELRDFAKGATDAKRGAPTMAVDGFALGRIQIIDGTLVHLDQRTNTGEEFRSIDMTVDAGDAKGPLQASGTLVWRGEPMRLDTRVMPMQALASGAPAQTSIAVTTQVGQLTFSGTATAAGAQPKLDGAVTAKSPSLAKASQWLGRPIVGDMANGPASFKGRLSATATRAALSDSNLQAQGLQMTGALTLDHTGARPKLTGALKFGDLNLDQLQRLRVLEATARPPPTVSAPRVSAQSPAGQPAERSTAPQSIEDLLKDPAAKPQVRGFVSRDGWSQTPLDLSFLGHLDTDLKIAFGRLVSQQFNTNQGQTHVVLNGRAARFTIEDLSLHEGKVRGVIALDAAHARPVLTINLAMDGISLGPLLKDAGAESIEGRAKIMLNLTGMGTTERQIVDTLTGKADLAVPRGAVAGYDLGAIVRDLTKLKLPNGERNPTARTEFTDLAASFTVAKGVADSKDFRVVTREARAIGNGQIAIGPRTIDFTVRPKLTAAAELPAGVGGPGINLAALDLPVRITGPLAQPNVSADFQSVMANPARALEAVDPTTRKEVEDTVKGVIAGDEAAKAKARQVLDRLFRR